MAIAMPLMATNRPISRAPPDSRSLYVQYLLPMYATPVATTFATMYAVSSSFFWKIR